MKLSREACRKNTKKCFRKHKIKHTKINSTPCLKSQNIGLAIDLVSDERIITSNYMFAKTEKYDAENCSLKIQESQHDH
ncbi:hypothetical protein ACPV3V_06375 [Vibrio alfacsensis]